MTILLAVLLGFCVDLILGDPRWMPHPVVYMGKAITRLERLLRRLLPDTPRALFWGGVVLAAVLPLPIPASVYGLLLLAAALKFGVLKLDQVRETGLFLTGIFPLLFVPAAAGVMELGSQLMNLLLPAVLAIVPVTALVMAVTGMVAQKCAGGKEHKNG